jgi:hypothetical protein
LQGKEDELKISDKEEEWEVTPRRYGQLADMPDNESDTQSESAQPQTKKRRVFKPKPVPTDEAKPKRGRKSSKQLLREAEDRLEKDRSQKTTKLKKKTKSKHQFLFN